MIFSLLSHLCFPLICFVSWPLSEYPHVAYKSIFKNKKRLQNETSSGCFLFLSFFLKPVCSFSFAVFPCVSPIFLFFMFLTFLIFSFSFMFSFCSVQHTFSELLWTDWIFFGRFKTKFMHQFSFIFPKFLQFSVFCYFHIFPFFHICCHFQFLC